MLQFPIPTSNGLRQGVSITSPYIHQKRHGKSRLMSGCLHDPKWSGADTGILGIDLNEASRDPDPTLILGNKNEGWLSGWPY
jgi:hypothetical protein